MGINRFGCTIIKCERYTTAFHYSICLNIINQLQLIIKFKPSQNYGKN